MAAKKASAKLKRKSVSGNMSKKSAPKKMPVIKETLSKGAIVKTITVMTELAKKDVVAVIEGLTCVIEQHVKAKGPGKFVLPGLLKITVVKKPAKPARRGINPFTGEEVTFKAKPASKAIKVKALKKLKEMATA